MVGLPATNFSMAREDPVQFPTLCEFCKDPNNLHKTAWCWVAQAYLRDNKISHVKGPMANGFHMTIEGSSLW